MILALTALLLILLGLWWRAGPLTPWDGEGAGSGSDTGVLGEGSGAWGPRGGVVLSERTARELASLPVAEKSGQGRYRREAFGQAWADEDRNGCDTRNDILTRDLQHAQLAPGEGCAVASGELADPYSGRRIEFTAGPESKAVQIDHVVALSDAWASGAQDWDLPRRRALANDPANLLAVDGQLNQDKGGSDAAAWLPPEEGFRCEYVARQIRVKAAYRLSVTAQEREAMLEVLGDCPGYELPEAGASGAGTSDAGASGASPPG